jgi:DeoR/GlpR family transcriptional regulator of sugar metabolism
MDAVAPPSAEQSPSRRRRDMGDYVLDAGSVSIADLAARFGVSQMTAYRDVDFLEAQGLLRKIRGGVSAQPSSAFESSVRYRISVHQREKEAIAFKALELIEPGMTVMFDDGTTLLPIVGSLGAIGGLTVITNFVPAITALSPVPGIQLIALGGEYRPRYDCFSGLLCTEMIDQLRADLLFLSASAIADGQVLHQDQDMVAMKRAMVRSSRRRILLADHSKLGRGALHRVGDIDEFDLLIIDDGFSEEQFKHVDDRAVALEIVPMGVERSSAEHRSAEHRSS